MKAMTLAVLLMHMTSAGGAGAEEKRAGKHAKDAEGEPRQGAVKTEITSLKGEITSLKEEFRIAREKQRLAAEEKKRQEEARYGVPAKTTPVPSSGGAGAPAR
ncbi:hypothetical protein D7X74_31770 [Corallococcus sp. CA047B]|uniref:hypothetical protein n=1 Tax=Corallococcus sp. CA047B TaxID=2316729 RepID=UPI000EA1A5A8|nr:hypothetical protein [Corallococcus sp. CA047B]RKH08362.1 hypothetical protein D7X74_31770 [Corallococcus sp. CA047B]